MERTTLAPDGDDSCIRVIIDQLVEILCTDLAFEMHRASKTGALSHQDLALALSSVDGGDIVVVSPHNNHRPQHVLCFFSCDEMGLGICGNVSMTAYGRSCASEERIGLVCVSHK